MVEIGKHISAFLLTILLHPFDTPFDSTNFKKKKKWHVLPLYKQEKPVRERELDTCI